MHKISSNNKPTIFDKRTQHNRLTEVNNPTTTCVHSKTEEEGPPSGVKLYIFFFSKF